MRASGRGWFRRIGGSEQFEAADHDRSLLRRKSRHDLGDEVRGKDLADPRDDVAPRIGQPDKNPSLVALVSDPGY
jgi:hypothetical protein